MNVEEAGAVFCNVTIGVFLFLFPLLYMYVCMLLFVNNFAVLCFILFTNPYEHQTDILS